MRQLLVAGICLLILSACGKSEKNSAGVMPGWVKAGSTALGMTFYVDHATIRKNGDMAEMSHLFDYTTAEVIKNTKTPAMSSKTQGEFNCKERQERDVSVSFYSGNMGKGEIVASVVNPQPWEPVPLGSVSSDLLNIACQKK